MKKILVIFILFISSSVVADDISDFQIEGISVGDSMLDHVSKKQIVSNTVDYYYKDNTFYAVNFDNIIPLNVYDGGEVYLKTNDKNYIIYSIFGAISFDNKNIDDCYKMKNTIVAELSDMFKDAEKTDYGTYAHPTDETGESKVTAVFFDFKSGDEVSVICYNWSRILKKVNRDHLGVQINSKEFAYWLNNKAY